MGMTDRTRTDTCPRRIGIIKTPILENGREAPK